MDSGGKDIEGRKYKFVPPEGGWGYMITASVVITHITTIVPSYGFGLLYGDFLAATGDETNGTTLTNAAFLGVSSLTGLVSSYLFKKYTYRQVGMAGSIFFCVGSFGNIFVQNLSHLIITYGVIQGFGFGLILPSVLSAMNVYFDTKLNLMMGLSQTFIIISSMICPLIIAYVVEAFGFRRALIVLALYSLLNIPATAALQPVERHMKKIPVDVQQEDDDTDPRRELSKAVLQTQQMNLLGDNKEQKLLRKIDDQTVNTETRKITCVNIPTASRKHLSYHIISYFIYRMFQLCHGFE